MGRLTPKRRKFAECVISGMNPSEAYSECYSVKNMKPSSIRAEAYRLMSNPDVSQLIEEGRAQAMEHAAWSREVAIDRLCGVNTVSYSKITKEGRYERETVSSFFQSLDRLREMTEPRESPEGLRPVFYFDPGELDRA